MGSRAQLARLTPSEGVAARGHAADVPRPRAATGAEATVLAVAPIAAVQNRLSYSDPGDLPTALACAERGVAYLAYSPFGDPAGLVPQAARRDRRRGVSAHRVLLAWLRHQSPNIVPLAEASRAASICDSAALIGLTYSDRQDLRVTARY